MATKPMAPQLNRILTEEWEEYIREATIKAGLPMRNYYKILGVASNAKIREIKGAYRKLSKLHHPDLNPRHKIATDMFKMIQEAYEMLSDPDRRRAYDIELKESEHDVSNEHDDITDNSWPVESRQDSLPDEIEGAPPFPVFLKFLFLVEILLGCYFLIYFYQLDLSSVPGGLFYWRWASWKLHLIFAVGFQGLSSVHAAFQLIFGINLRSCKLYVFLASFTSVCLIAPSVGLNMAGLSCKVVLSVLIMNLISAISVSIWLLNERFKIR